MKWLRWFVVNGFMVALLYAEKILMIEQAGWVLNFWCVFFGILCFLILCVPFDMIEESICETPYSRTYHILDTFYDMGFISALIYFEKWWMAGFFFFIMICSMYIQDKKRQHC